MADPSLVVMEDVEGAPLRIGTRVLVQVDARDLTADPRFAGTVGVVKAFVFDCPVEQYPHDPLILVEVPGVGEDLFFSRELAPQLARVHPLEAEVRG